MAYTHNELKHKTLAELRDIAKDIEHDAVQGYTQLNKEHLVVAICTGLEHRNARAPRCRRHRQSRDQDTH